MRKNLYVSDMYYVTLKKGQKKIKIIIISKNEKMTKNMKKTRKNEEK